MPWIRSESNLSRHPKTLALKSMLNIEMDALIGRLHFLWWWTLEYALDGDLSRKEPKVIEEACRVPLKMLVRAGFVDARPYRRIHDWWDNQGNYLKLRFKDSPDKWMQIRDLYQRKEHQSIPSSKGSSNTTRIPVDVDLIPKRTDVANGRTDVDLTKTRSRPAPGGASATRDMGLTKVEADDMPEFDHEDFKKAGWINSERPAESDSFAWDHFNRAMNEVERVQSKTREKFFAQKKHWN